jgi:hypothetical protein
MEAAYMTNSELSQPQARLAAAALKAWKTNIDRAGKFFSSLNEEQLQAEVAPGKNRLLYLWGHLTAVNDAMLPLLGFGDRLHPELDAIFISVPDKSVPNPPSAKDLKNAWDEVNAKLTPAMQSLSAGDWLQKHNAVSEEDFAKEPDRNRFAILLGRTNHLAYHVGQAILAPRS